MADQKQQQNDDKTCLDWLLPDFAVCADSTTEMLTPAIKDSVQALQDAGDSEETGSQDWGSECFEVWQDLGYGQT